MYMYMQGSHLKICSKGGGGGGGHKQRISKYRVAGSYMYIVSGSMKQQCLGGSGGMFLQENVCF